MTTQTIRHVLLDADGVVQEGSGDIVGALQVHLGDGAVEMLAQLFPENSPVLRGEQEVVPLLIEAIGEDVDVQALYDDAWLAIDVHRPTIELARRLREAGYGVHLATNQDPARGRFMRSSLGYGDVFDESFYSSEMGVTKPAAAFFERILEQLGAAPSEVLFIDDSQPNVDGARAAGMHAELWSIPTGDQRLIDLLTSYDVTLT